jgi:hypothetical protein
MVEVRGAARFTLESTDHRLVGHQVTVQDLDGDPLSQ